MAQPLLSLGRYPSLSSRYCGFADSDESFSFSSPSVHAPDSMVTPFNMPFRSVVPEISTREVQKPALGPGLSIGSASLLRSVSVGAYAWASSQEVLENCGSVTPSQSCGGEALAELDCTKQGVGEIIKPSGSMMLLLTKYETTLKSLGLENAEDCFSDKEEETDLLFSRWGFHYGRLTAPEERTSIEDRALSGIASVNQHTCPQTKRKYWFLRKSPSQSSSCIPSRKWQCMPWSWRRITSWRLRRGYKSVPGQDRFDDEVATPQRSYTDGHAVVMGDTLSFTDLRLRKHGKHRTCFSWGGSGDMSPCEDEIYLLEDTDRSEGKKAA